MKAKLLPIDPGIPRTRIVLKKLPVVVGRGPDVHVHLEDRWLSRVHCEISEINGTLLVRDLESTNGTLVNGELVTEALLMPGDRLTVGLTSFQVQYKRGKVGVFARAAGPPERSAQQIGDESHEARASRHEPDGAPGGGTGHVSRFRAPSKPGGNDLDLRR